MNKSVILTLLLLAVFTCKSTILAQEDDEYSRKTLHAIKSLGVSVTEIEDELLKQKGITTSQLQTDVELKLRLAGISIYDDSLTRHVNEGAPYVFVQITIIRSPSDIYSYHINFELRQIVQLGRDSTIYGYGTTWSAGNTGLLGTNKLQFIRDCCKDLTDKFINAYLSVNK